LKSRRLRLTAFSRVPGSTWKRRRERENESSVFWFGIKRVMNHRGKEKTETYSEIDYDWIICIVKENNNTWEVDRRWEARVELFKKNAMVWFCWFENYFVQKESSLGKKKQTCEFWFGAFRSCYYSSPIN